MKTFFRIVLRTLIGVVSVVALFLVTTTVVNAIYTGVEDANRPVYGQKVTVDGKQMNIATYGTGEQQIVMLPGQGTPSPALDFAPLIRELEDVATIHVVEPFGYGLSDPTDVPRTTENIVREVHAAVEQLDLDEYVLAGHSITGIYALDYVAAYPDEVTAFVGVDTSVPNQPGMDRAVPVVGLQSLKNLGIIRLVTVFGSDPMEGLAYTDDERAQLRSLTMKNSMSDTMADEMRHIGPNFAAAAGKTFPHDLPVLLFAQAHNPAFPTWEALHQEQADSVEDGTLVLVDGEHYLHHTHAPEIGVQTRAFLERIG